MNAPRRRCLLLLLALAPVWLWACSADEGGEAVVRPFEDVQASPLSFEADPNDPTSAIFRVTTTEPMICAIVWGEDDSFGRFNNSLSMNGTGITQHDVVLPDIQPGRTYRYVVQGTTADGTLYRSEVAGFTIEASGPPTTERVDRGENLALAARIVDVSSEFSSEFAAANVIDGDDMTEWATRGDGDDGFVVVDLGGEQDLGGVEFITRSMADGSSITDTFTVTVDGGTTFGPFPAGTIADPRFAELSATGRLLRFDVESSTGGNVGAVEIRIYGPDR